ncbi:MAG: 50S ribosomal protein L22 [Candidatus Woesearchaeota archaeon]
MVKYSVVVAQNEAAAMGRALEISTKHSAEVCALIRGKPLEIAKGLLREVIAQKRAVPYRRSRRDLAHKKGIAAGRYPVKTCAKILELLELAEANAQFKGLPIADLFVKHIASHRGPKIPKSGRKPGRVSKRAHIEVVLAARQEQK